MDLLGDLGAADQLTSTRAENKVLKEKVQFLEGRMKVLAVENEALKAEVEMYRQEFATTPSSSQQAGADGARASSSSGSGEVMTGHDKDHFVKSGNGVYCRKNHDMLLLEKLHGISNPSCCSLSSDDTILATGGADRHVQLLPWGGVTDSDSSAEKKQQELSVKMDCGAPVIAVDFSRKPRSRFVGAGCMDGSVHVMIYTTRTGEPLKIQRLDATIKHAKYVRTMAWSAKDNILATGSADGCVQIHKVIWNGFEDDVSTMQLEKMQTLNLSGPVESLCFFQHDDNKDVLICYARGTPYLSYFDMSTMEHTKQNLNQGTTGNAAFQGHVSFCVMDIQVHGPYMALATDTSRIIIMEFATGRQVRNLYGHKNDGYSHPKIAWSKNGQYMYGNTQEDATICIWDIATGNILDRLEGHTNPIRDMFSSPLTDTLVTTSFDKKTHVWFAPSE